MRRKNSDFLDGRVTERSIVLFRLAKMMMAKGHTLNASNELPMPLTREFTFTDPGLLPKYKTLIEVSRDLDRELGIKPWQPGILDFAVCDMKSSSYPPHADFFTIAELHRRLQEATT